MNVQQYLDNLKTQIEIQYWTGLIIWSIIWGAICALIAQSKGNSAFGGFLWRVLLGPIGLLIVIFTAGNRCSECKKAIHRQARVCPYCNANVHRKEAEPSYAAERTEAEARQAEARQAEVIAEAITEARQAEVIAEAITEARQAAYQKARAALTKAAPKEWEAYQRRAEADKWEARRTAAVIAAAAPEEWRAYQKARVAVEKNEGGG